MDDRSDPGTGRAEALARLLRSAWHAGVLPRPRLRDLDAAAARVAEQAGERDPPWRRALRQLIASLEEEAALSEVGLTFAHVQLSALLRQRARAQALWRRQPEILDLPTPSPVIVLGHMRSGTTRVQRLLGCDERFAHPRFFEVMAPAAPAIDLRRLKSWAQLTLLNALNPQLQAVHPTSATAVEEVFGLLSFSFYGAQFEAQWRVPSFARYWEQRDRTWVYREFRRLLQLIAWQRGAAGKPWVLKAPQFMEDLEPLLQVFPDARLICLSRDPAGILPSSASLVWHQMKLQSAAPDRHWIGREWLRKTALRERASRAVLAARPQVPRIEVDFAAVNRDWRAEMRRVYAFLGLPLTPAVEGRMQAYLARAETSGFRGHRYQAEDFGLTPGALTAWHASA